MPFEVLCVAKSRPTNSENISLKEKLHIQFIDACLFSGETLVANGVFSGALDLKSTLHAWDTNDLRLNGWLQTFLL